MPMWLYRRRPGGDPSLNGVEGRGRFALAEGSLKIKSFGRGTTLQGRGKSNGPQPRWSSSARNLASIFIAFALCPTLACSPRNFLTRRLAADLISASPTFVEPQVFWMKIGIVSNRDFNSPDSMVLQHRGWIIGTQQKCPPGTDPPPCWDVILSPLGVDVFRQLISSTESGPSSVRVARRELVAISGISKAGNFADVEFTWRWVALNQIGSALYDSGVHYRSVVAFRSFDDGWRLMDKPFPGNQSLDDALRNAEPVAP